MDKTRILFLRILLPLMVVTLGCSLFSPIAKDGSSAPSSDQNNDIMEVTVEGAPALTSTEAMPADTASPPAENPTATQAQDHAPTATSVPEGDGQSSLQPVFAWIPEPIFKSQAAGLFANLKIDSQDDLHLAFFQDTDDEVWWMQGQKGKWDPEKQVTGGSGRGFHVSMALDSSDNPHFAYHSVDTDQLEPILYYKYWTGNSWAGVFKNPDYRVVNTDISIAVGPDDRPHILFLEDYGGNLVYARFGKNGFVNQIVGQADLDLKGLAIIVDDDGVPHLVYKSVDQGLMYATLRDQKWDWDVVDPGSGVGTYADIAIDHVGGLHIAYYDQNEGRLNYASPTEGGWESRVVDAGDDLGHYPSIVVDSSGSIHISYYDADNERLKYAYGIGGDWLIQTVDDQGSVGEYSAIALDSKDNPYIVYYDRKNQDLKLARAMPLSP